MRSEPLVQLGQQTLSGDSLAISSESSAALDAPRDDALWWGDATPCIDWWTRFCKRTLDVSLSALALVMLSPLFLVIALVIRWKTPGDIFFRQSRCGRDGKTFTCYKFRTMCPDAHDILFNDTRLRDSFLQNWKLADDPRVTPVGRILRKTSLDELPQLWNVLKGDMSIVGPRPVVLDELLGQYADCAQVVTSVRPGMTGLWQVSGRSSLSYEDRVNLDVHYVRRLSIWFDILIIFRTMPALFGSKDAS
jgi:undecaprenyl-phosphate galactose phosphotransferase